MFHVAQSKNTAAVITVAVLALVCLCAAVTPVFISQYGGTRIPPLLKALWRPVFWISLAGGLVIAGRFLMTRFTYALRPSSVPLRDDDAYIYEGAPEYILGTPVYHSDDLDFLVLKKTGLGREFRDFDMPLRSFVSCSEQLTKPFFAGRSVRSSFTENSSGDMLSELHNYTSVFMSRRSVLVVFADGERNVGLLIDDDNPISDFFRKRSEGVSRERL